MLRETSENNSIKWKNYSDSDESAKYSNLFLTSSNIELSTNRLIYRICFNIGRSLSRRISICIHCNKNNPEYNNLSSALTKAGFIKVKGEWRICTTNIKYCKKFLNIIDQFESLENLQDNFFQQLEKSKGKLKFLPKWEINNYDLSFNYYNKKGQGIARESRKRLIYEFFYCYANYKRVLTTKGLEHCAQNFYFNFHFNKRHPKYNQLLATLNIKGFDFKIDPHSSNRSELQIPWQWVTKFIYIIDEFEALENVRDKILLDVYRFQHTTMSIADKTKKKILCAVGPVFAFFKHPIVTRHEDDSDIKQIEIKQRYSI